jgi:ssDNA-binding Zn-finger/Zn-ribbon topoisomerase 1
VNRATLKLIAAAGLLGAALLIYFYNSRGEPVPENDETLSFWFCTQTGKGFSLDAIEAQDKVKLRRKQGGDDQSPLAFRGRNVSEQVAFSPFTNEYTGVEAYKCPKCGEIFPAQNEQGENNVCPKCKWDANADEAAPPTEPPQSP